MSVSEPEINSTSIELRRVLAEMALRKIEGLKLYKPMGFQQAFHESMAQERIIRGGNRCLAGSQEVYDPVICHSLPISAIGEPFHVFSMDPNTGEVWIKKSSAPFVKGRGELFEYALSNGKSIKATPEHLVLDSIGRWVSIGSAYALSRIILESGESCQCHVLSAKSIGVGDIWDITVDDWSNYICAGLVNHNSGKSIAAAAEIARAITGQDIHDKYPKKDGICYVVGKQAKEISQVLYPLLFEAGAIRMIRDSVTKEFRAWNPEREDDLARKKEAKKCPAFVPKRMVVSIAWEDRKRNLPSMIKLTTGWRVYFYTSEGKPTQGTAIDLAWFDEEILLDEWYNEISARLIDKSGRFFWSATPQAGTEKLFSLHERAEDQVERNVQPRTIEEFFCTISGNKYMAEADKELFIAKHEDDENTYNVRVLGGFAMLAGRVYPEYTPRTHEIAPREVPADWTRYVAIDPGRQICAVLFGAAPPPELGDFFYLYDELYIRDCTAAMFGYEMGRKVGDQTFYTFIIDMTDARKHDQGGGRKLVDQYSEQLKLNRVSSILTGDSFETGYSEVKSGLEAVRHWLRLRQDGTPKIRAFSTLKNFSKEMIHYRNRQVKTNGRVEFVDQPVKRRDHLCDCLRYLVQRQPVWVPPKKGQGRPTGAYAVYLKMQKQAEDRQRANGSSTIVLGPQAHDGDFD